MSARQKVFKIIKAKLAMISVIVYSNFDKSFILYTNTFCKNGKKSSLNILLKKVLTINIANETAVIGDEEDKISKY